MINERWTQRRFLKSTSFINQLNDLVALHTLYSVQQLVDILMVVSSRIATTLVQITLNVLTVGSVGMSRYIPSNCPFLRGDPDPSNNGSLGRRVLGLDTCGPINQWHFDWFRFFFRTSQVSQHRKC